jgi:hypothetical protein
MSPRRILLCFAFVAALWASATARAQTTDTETEPPVDFDACFAAHARGQSSRIEGELLEAREALEVCSNAACPSVVRSECGAWLSEVRAEIPSVRFAARRGHEPLTEVRVYADERLLSETIDPAATYDLDPGVYTFRFEHETFGEVEVAGAVRRGDRGRLIAAEFVVPVAVTPPPPPVPVAPAPRPFVVPDSAWGLGATALALFAGSAGVGIAALVERGDALTTCAPFCSGQLVGRLRGELIASDVLWATATAAALTAIILLFVDQPSGDRHDASSVRLTREGIAWW